MKANHRLACGVVIAAIVCTNAHAQASISPTQRTAKSPIGIAVDVAWERSVESRSVEGKRELAVASRSAASYLWAAPPSVELSRRDDRGSSSPGGRESEVGLTVPMLLPGQRSARTSVANADFELAETSLIVAKLRVAGEVREAAWDIVGKQSELQVADALVASLKSLADDVEKRIAAGDLARADGLAARAELYSATGAASEARQRLRAAIAHWKTLTGIEPITDASESMTGTVPEVHPELSLAAKTTTGAGSRLELTHATRREPPEITFRVRQDVPGPGLPSQNSIGIGIRIPLGTGDRNLPREVAARTELDVARTTEARLREKLAGEIVTARESVVAAEQQTITEKIRADLLHERAELFEKSFRAGETSLPDLLRATLAAAQAQASLAKQQAISGLAKARLQQSIGVIP